ncbi:MAG TPA: DUF2207 domain-containing protein [Patescibacteria group bacterium]|nr:DUF2207 domain-containing protein [Patescibacteria group bacterium]
MILIFPLAAGAQTSERILSYRSDIQVMRDASMRVTETIRVVSAREQIRHGIYRDFPIAYRDRLGNRFLVGFDLLGVARDGSAEPYHIQRAGNGLRIYIGDENILIPPGEHVYTITYETDRQLGFFQDHDELYWNVTGNGWVFDIEQATARVTLPTSVPAENITATLYTGIQGSTAQEGTWRIIDGQTVEFTASSALAAYEGLTLVVGWPKGIVTEPTAAQNFWAAVRANLDYITGLLGLLLVAAYYLYAWNRHGRDPARGAIVAQYEPPRGFSPALLRFIRRMGSDSRTFAAAVISLAVKGRLTITEDKAFLRKTTYILAKRISDTAAALAPDEQVLESKLFAGTDILKLDRANAPVIKKIRDSFTDALKEQAGKKYFSKNIGTLALGIFVSIVVVASTIAAAVSARYSVGSALPVIFWIFFPLSLLTLNIAFGWLLRAFTPEGRQLTDEIDGFKLFLSVTEKDRLAFHNPPQRTPELFEKLLPYALALGVEHQWAGQFADVFARLDSQGTRYAPVWYYGVMSAHFNADDFASTMGSSFTGVVSSASTPPGSGSGFSGGSGGGGGGGGGW